jgi:glycosyltransferase involved in cell wall biosynthesis
MNQDRVPEYSFEVSIILPARNEAANLEKLLPRLMSAVNGLGEHAEVIVVDDGSTDQTRAVCEANGVSVVSHPYAMGNGAAVKSGARAARGRMLVFMDGDGQHDPADIPRLLEKLRSGYAMAVGARESSSQANIGRSIANTFYNRLAGWMVGHQVKDLTSGFRAVAARQFKEFLYLLPNGFSYPTTSTMAFFRAGYPVAYVPITAARRGGKSHIRPMADGARFLLIMFRICTLYSPLKLFVPISATFLLTALGYYCYTYLMYGRFTNMTGLLFSTSVIIFLVGLVSEQITQLLYSKRQD